MDVKGLLDIGHQAEETGPLLEAEDAARLDGAVLIGLGEHHAAEAFAELDADRTRRRRRLRQALGRVVNVDRVATNSTTSWSVGKRRWPVCLSTTIALVARYFLACPGACPAGGCAAVNGSVARLIASAAPSRTRDMRGLMCISSPRNTPLARARDDAGKRRQADRHTGQGRAQSRRRHSGPGKQLMCCSDGAEDPLAPGRCQPAMAVALARRQSDCGEPPQRERPEPSFENSGLCNFDGRGERIRTSDLSVPNRALYQAEPRPDNLKSLQRLRRALANAGEARHVQAGRAGPGRSGLMFRPGRPIGTV